VARDRNGRRRGRRRRGRADPRAQGRRQREIGTLDHHDYALLWQQTHLGEARDAVLARWPTVPDEHYTDNLKDDCFEWSDERRYIYNLCFNAGILRSKELI